MSNYKIFTKNNVFRIVPVIGQGIYEEQSKVVRVIPEASGNSVYRFENVRNWNADSWIPLTSIVKENGTPYTLTEWENFYTANVGNFNSAVGGITALEIDATEITNGTSGEFLVINSDGTLGSRGNLQIEDAIIAVVDWVLVGGVYENILTIPEVTASSFVEVIPNNSDVDIVSEAEVFPSIEVGAGTIKIFAKNEPTDDFSVTLTIIKN